MKFKDTMSLGWGRTCDLAKAKSPELLLAGGIILLAGSVVMACKSTLKLQDKLDLHNEEIASIKESREIGEYTEEEEAKELTVEYGKFAFETAALYFPSVLVFGLGLGCVAGSYKILKHRNNELVRGLIDMGLATAAYRGRVAEVVGEDKEYDLFHNIKRETVEEEYIDENGKKKKRKVEKIISQGERGGHNSYFFGAVLGGDGDFNPHFKDAASNARWMRETEIMFNRMLVGRGDKGYMTKKEVLDYFTFSKCDPFPYESLINGWIFIEDQAENYEYPYVDYPSIPRIIKFGVSNDFAKGREAETWVEFNCYPLAPILSGIEDKYTSDRLRAKGVA